MATSTREWHGMVGMIDLEILRSRLPIVGLQYYVPGPPAMVIAMQQTLAQAGVRADDVIAEEFAGY